MKLGVSQSTVQSDATNIIPCLGLLSYVTVAASSRAPTRSPPTSPGARDVARHGRARVVGGRTGSGVEAPAEFIMDELSDEFFRHALGKGAGRLVGEWRWRGCGGGGGSAGLAAFVLRFVLFFDVVVDVPVVQVVDLVSCPLLCKTGVMVQTVQPVEFPRCSSWTRW